MREQHSNRGRRRRRGAWVAAVAVALMSVVASPPSLRAAESPGPVAEEPADAWLGGDGAVPPPEAGVVEGGSRFALLAASRGGNRMTIRWPNPGPAATEVTVWASADEPGHWGVRDWRRFPMAVTRTGEGESWEAAVPVASVAVPTVYSVRGVIDGLPRVSGLRIFRPERAGMTEPTSPFLGFVDGFEEGLEGWEGPVVEGRAGVVSRSTNALSGRWSLRVEVPPGRGSVVVGTVRIRGWMLREPGVTAVRLAVRTESGEGRLRLALHSRARTDRLAVHPVVDEPRVGPQWQRVEVPLEAFRGLEPGAVDWFSVQLVAESGRALLLDDVELELR